MTTPRIKLVFVVILIFRRGFLELGPGLSDDGILYLLLQPPHITTQNLGQFPNVQVEGRQLCGYTLVEEEVGRIHGTPGRVYQILTNICDAGVVETQAMIESGGRGVGGRNPVCVVMSALCGTAAVHHCPIQLVQYFRCTFRRLRGGKCESGVRSLSKPQDSWYLYFC